ncbi:MAG: hypothetical protein KatS3mg099_238 [Candidatus Parcubacteria bacterium]|nr:MAG: hypothetical protein KatS3mg099_238 [Candidatus Parcubacteria bacterium]
MFENNEFVGDWPRAIVVTYGDNRNIVGPLGHYGPNHPTEARIKGNVFEGRPVILIESNGRGKAYRVLLEENKGSGVSCRVRNNFELKGNSPNLYDWSTLDTSAPTVVMKGNSFSCSLPQR